MPWIAEYVCDAGHRFSHLHEGTRETTPEFVPCEYTVIDREPTKCPRLAEKVISAPRIKTIARGNGDYRERERERLEQRSKEWDKSKAGKQSKLDTIERRLKKGEVV